MAEQKFRKKNKHKKKTLKEKLISAACIAAFAVFITAAALDYFGIMSYDNMVAAVHLRDVTISDAELTVHFIDAGQGDSVLIKSGDTSILIDGGESEYGRKVTEYLRSQDVADIDYMIATHPHSDHIGGLSEVLDEFEVHNIITPEVEDEVIPSSPSCSRFFEAAANEAANNITAVPGDVYDIGTASFVILSPCSDYDNINNYSVSVMLTHGENKFLFTGDAEEESENDMLEMWTDLSADVLKAGHHGSSTSSSEEFIEAVSPQYAVISCGAGNSYNHPSASVMDRLSECTSKIFRTDIEGTIIAESDGKNINFVTTEK